MSLLRLFSDASDAAHFEDHRDFAAIAAVARASGFQFERWQATRPLPEAATPEQVLAAYAEDVARLQQERGFATRDVLGVGPHTPEPDSLRRKFLEEHIHSEDEARFFVEGAGVFAIHAGGQVIAILCEQGDLINVPAGTPHWFDMGPAPRFQCIRLFTDPRGWVAEFTGSPIASRFPGYVAMREAADQRQGGLAVARRLPR